VTRTARPAPPSAEPPLDDAGRRAWADEAAPRCRALRYRAWAMLAAAPLLLLVGAVTLDAASDGGGPGIVPKAVLAAVAAVDLWLGLRWRHRAVELQARIDTVRRELAG